jgi:hypothetical protein
MKFGLRPFQSLWFFSLKRTNGASQSHRLPLPFPPPHPTPTSTHKSTPCSSRPPPTSRRQWHLNPLRNPVPPRLSPLARRASWLLGRCSSQALVRPVRLQISSASSPLRPPHRTTGRCIVLLVVDGRGWSCLYLPVTLWSRRLELLVPVGTASSVGYML